VTELLQKLRQLLMRRRHQYQLTFRSPPGQEVLRDLAIFCRAGKSTFHEDPRLHALAEGRREVWLRISSHIDMTPDQLWKFYDGREE
jgi:hypothetical protein